VSAVPERTTATGDALLRAGIDEACARAATAAASEPTALHARLAELARRIDQLEKAIVAHWEEIEFRLDEIEAELVQLSRPGWPFEGGPAPSWRASSSSG
jgi:hypothetical protein